MTDYTVDEAAELLPVSAYYLRSNLHRLPHTRWGDKRRGRITFTEEHIEEIRKLHEQRPEPAAQPKALQGATRRRAS